MKLDEFINKYNGKKVDYDGAFGAQCVDLFRQYCKDVLNIPHTGSVNGAKELYLNYDSMPQEEKYFIKKSRFEVAGRAGFVAVYDATSSNIYGHVAIVLGTMPDGDLIVFEQNGFAQDGAKIVIRNSKNLMGYLIKRIGVGDE